MTTRSVIFIENTSPCDTDYRDPQVQAILGNTVLCSNLSECRKRSAKENIQCSLKYAQMMATRIVRAREKGLKEFMIAIKDERKSFLRSAPRGKYWVFGENGNWSVIRGRRKVFPYVIAFARIILNGTDNDST